jgi:hypothetical protein
METFVLYVLYAISCLPCTKEIPQVYKTQAECNVALAKWTKKTVPSSYSFFGGFNRGLTNGGSCLQEKLTQREIDAYGGVKE